MNEVYYEMLRKQAKEEYELKLEAIEVVRRMSQNCNSPNISSTNTTPNIAPSGNAEQPKQSAQESRSFSPIKNSSDQNGSERMVDNISMGRCPKSQRANGITKVGVGMKIAHHKEIGIHNGETTIAEYVRRICKNVPGNFSIRVIMDRLRAIYELRDRSISSKTVYVALRRLCEAGELTVVCKGTKESHGMVLYSRSV